MREAAKRNGSIKCALMIDEISIKKHVEWVGNRFSGYIDLGTDLDDDLLLPAKETFTFMLNSINGN